MRGGGPALIREEWHDIGEGDVRGCGSSGWVSTQPRAARILLSILPPAKGAA